MVTIIRSAPVLHSHWAQYLQYVAQGITMDYGDKLVLKGGTALKLCYELPRMSIDLDFDSLEHHNLESSLKTHSMDFFNHNFNISGDFSSIIKQKNTIISSHYIIHWKSFNKNLRIAYSPLTIDVSIRKINKEFRNDICIQNGICTYNLDRLIDTKLNAIVGIYAKKRTKLKDFFDAEFILNNY
ncbi:MAG: nucleotidyl transferase AbiEii/AbiGii toxin family protein [Deltaproteobacteria bacterium]|jgi:hypothetical protein|nr:nucleotidyl transferase AbiEii/AbiGii toxin family protein [Deltaproteobacteria bacterium]